MKVHIKYKLILLLLPALFACTLESNAQSFTVKGYVIDKQGPIPGIPIFIDSKYTSRSLEDGYFETVAKLGDTLKISSVFYSSYINPLKDTLLKRIELVNNDLQLSEIKVNFNKRKVIDSILNLSFSKLIYDDDTKGVFLRQSLIKNNNQKLLLNEGLVEIICPKANNFSNLKDNRKIDMNIVNTCSVLNSLGPTSANYAIDPRKILLKGFVPQVYYETLIPTILEETIKTDSVNTTISITGYYLSRATPLLHVWIIDSKTGILKEVHYSIFYSRKKEGSFVDCVYKDNKLTSVLANGVQHMRGNIYSFCEEFYLDRRLGEKLLKTPFNPHRCGLHEYLKETGNCDQVNDYKKLKRIPAQKFF